MSWNSSNSPKTKSWTTNVKLKTSAAPFAASRSPATNRNGKDALSNRGAKNPAVTKNPGTKSHPTRKKNTKNLALRPKSPRTKIQGQKSRGVKDFATVFWRSILFVRLFACLRVSCRLVFDHLLILREDI